MTKSGPLSPADAAAEILRALDAGERAAALVVVHASDPARVGDRVVVRDGRLLGSLGDAEANAAALRLASEGLTGEGAILPGLKTLRTQGGEELEVYLELHHPEAEMIIVGAGHLAKPLCTLGALLGLNVQVLDDRPDFATRERFPEAVTVRRVDFSDPFIETPLHPWSHVILVTRGHRHDYQCLRKVLAHEPLPGYIGMIGSRRRVKATFEALLDEHVSRGLLASVHAPIGLDIGAETPEEIAVSVAAELVHHWRGGTGRPFREVENVLDRLMAPGHAEEAGLPSEGEGGR